LWFTDAITFIESFKAIVDFNTFNGFLDILHKFESRIFEIDEVIAELIALSRGNKQILVSFDRFLPASYSIVCDKSGNPELVTSHTFNEALEFLDMLKVAWAETPHTYNQFKDIMVDYKDKKLDTPSLLQEVELLFAGNNKFIAGFNRFASDGHKIECFTSENQRIIRRSERNATRLSNSVQKTKVSYKVPDCCLPLKAISSIEALRSPIEYVM